MKVIPKFAKKLESKVMEALNNNQLKKFSVTTELHHVGINCRNMGLVRSVIPPDQGHSRMLLLIEMVLLLNA